MSWKAAVTLEVWKWVGGGSYVRMGWKTVPVGEAALAAAALRASCTRGLPDMGTHASATSTLRVTSTDSLFKVW